MRRSRCTMPLRNVMEEICPSPAVSYTHLDVYKRQGHISSITFRSGIVHRDLRIELDPAGNLLTEPRQIANTVYEGPLFQRKLQELGLESDFTERVLERLGWSFGLETLRDALTAELQHSSHAHGEAGEDQLRAQSIWTVSYTHLDVYKRQTW